MDMKKLRIAIVASCQIGGGAEKVARLIANSFVKYGHSVMYISACASKDGGDIDQNIVCKNIRQIWPRSVTRNFLILNETRKFKVDCIISFLIKETLLAEFCGMPVITSLRFDPNSSYEKKWLRIAFSRSKHTVFQTVSAKKYFTGKIFKNGVIIPNPLEDDLPYWNNDVCQKKVIAVGRLCPEKNFELLISSFVLFHDIHPDYTLHIYGEGFLKDDLDKQIRSSGAEDYIKLEGFSEKIPELMLESIMFCQTSNREGLSNAMLEALAIGIPTICTDCPIGGAKEYIKNGVNGYLIPMGGKDELVRVMCAIVESGELRCTMSKEAVKIRESLSLESICRKWEALVYDSVRRVGK